MKNLYKFFGMLLLITACSEDLDQFPPNLAESSTLTSFANVLNAAYFYQHASVTPMAVMGDFRSDNMLMDEEPYPEFDRFTSGLTVHEDQFFAPFYRGLYKSILSANNVIENSENATEVGEAKFLRALSYFKLVLVFGDVPVNLSATPSTTDNSILERQPVDNIYNDVIIPDLTDAINALDVTIVNGRASRYAAQGLLGKVYMHRGNFSSAETHLAAVVNGAAAAGITLQANFADVFGDANDLNSEIIFATQISSTISDEYGFTEFVDWYGGADTKSSFPLDPDLIAAFNASSAAAGATDARGALTILETATDQGIGVKYPQNADVDWIELRLADVLLLYAEALNENADSQAARENAFNQLDALRVRAGLPVLDETDVAYDTQAEARAAIALERRVELALEGHRWFDLVRTGTVDAEMGQTIDPDYHVFPIPNSEVLASDGVITQNDGY